MKYINYYKRTFRSLIPWYNINYILFIYYSCVPAGTVLYSHACHMADQLLGSNANPSLVATSGGHSIEERRVRAAFAHAASYIMLAFALQPTVQVYQSSIMAVQRLLPLPYLRTGLLFVTAAGTAGTAEEHWVPAWLALDAFVLQSMRPPPAEASRFKGPVPNVAIDVVDVSSAYVCQDPTLPPGWAIWIGLRDQADGIFIVAEEKEDAEGWVDALRLLAAVGKSDGGAERLQQALVARRQRQPSGSGGGGSSVK